MVRNSARNNFTGFLVWLFLEEFIPFRMIFLENLKYL